jgi:hypothetical protein
MLDEMATIGSESIISWQPHGTAFRVHQPKEFARIVMPRYFKQTKYKSFQRQLHIYGFCRIGKGSFDRGAYVHPMFVRHNKSMSLRMSCIKIKGKKNKSSNAVHHDRAAIVLDDDESQNIRGLTNVLQADPILPVCTTTKENKKTSGSTTNRQHPGVDAEPLVNNALLFDQEVPAGGLVDWMKQAQTILSSEDEEQASPYHMYADISSVSGGGHGGDHQKHFDEGLFEGKRFFDVVETIMEVTRSISMKDFLKPIDSSMSWKL